MTIYDIAKLAGVSASTVSRVINEKPGIKESTRQRVKQLLKEHNYTPDENARGLVNRNTRLIGILVVVKMSRKRFWKTSMWASGGLRPFRASRRRCSATRICMPLWARRRKPNRRSCTSTGTAGLSRFTAPMWTMP